MSVIGRIAALIAAVLVSSVPVSHSWAQPAPQMNAQAMHDRESMPPMMDHAVFAHAIAEQLEGRANGAGTDFRWHGQAWIGGDRDRLWFESEGTRTHKGRTEDARHELLYDRAVSTWMNARAGVRSDLDSGTGRSWAALGIRGLAPQFIEYEATAFLSDRGHTAARLALSYDLPISQRLILRPEVEANFYRKADPGRAVGSGLADIDAGMRLRYEVSRKFAPYVGISYAGKFGETAVMARRAGDRTDAITFVFGIRGWM